MDALANAVITGDLETLRVELARRPELVDALVDLDQRRRPSDTQAMRLIHLAIAENQLEAARLLIRHGAALNLRNADGRLPLHDCFELGRDAFAELLLASGAELDICAAAAYGKHAALREILARDPAPANDLQTGLTPIAWSIYGDQPESVRILLAHGALVDRAPYDAIAWQTLSHVASVDLARLLLRHGANPNLRDARGDTPLHAVLRSRIVGDPTAFVELLLRHGADPAAVDREGRTPLQEALQQAGQVAETYFPVRPLAVKNLSRVIEMLRSPNS